MRTKVINVSFDEVKVVNILLDLGNFENYLSKFLALKNHERETEEILEVRGIRDSNSVHVTLLIDEEEDEAKEIQHCKDFIEQFGKIERCEVDTAWILNKDENNIDYALNYEDCYIYG